MHSNIYHQALVRKRAQAKWNFRKGCVNERLKNWTLAADSYASALALDGRRAGWHYHHGLVLAAMQKWVEAIDAYHCALARDASCALWHYRLAQAYSEIRDYHAAVDACKHALKLDGRQATWQDFLGCLYENIENFHEAEICYRFAIEIDDQRPNTYFHLALVCRRLGMLTDALDACRQAVELREDNAVWMYTLATLFEDVADFSSAQKAYEIALAKGKAPSVWYFRYGKVCTALGETQKAVVAYQHAIMDEAALAEWHFCLGFLLERLKFWIEAKDAYSKALSKSTAPDPDWYFRLGCVHNYLKQWAESSEAYRQALQLKPGKVAWRFRLGRAEEWLGNWPAAEAEYRQALDGDARHADWYFRFGRVLEHQKKWFSARDAYLQAIALAPNKPDWYFRLSVVFSACEELLSAIQSIKKALDLEERATWQAHHARLLERTKSWQIAADMYARALLKDPGQADWHHHRGICLRELRRWPEALESYNSASDIEPERAVWQADVAAMLLKSGQVEQAIKRYRTALALEPMRRDWTAELWRLLRTSDPAAAMEMLEQGALLGNAALLREAAALIDAQNQIMIVPAKSLIRAERLDIAVKILFARSLLKLPTGNSFVSRTDMYRRHIHLRTGGKEPGNLSKRSFDDYRDAFNSLIGSISKEGFDKNSPIPFGKDKSGMLNGAHRLSAAIALGVNDVAITIGPETAGLGWGFPWFVDKGFTPGELNELLFCWMEENVEKGNIIILWPAIKDHWQTITSKISSEISVVTYRDVTLEKFGLREMARETVGLNSEEEATPDMLEQIQGLKSCGDEVRFLIVDSSARQLEELKRNISRQYAELDGDDYFGTLHASRSHHEAMHLAKTLLHEQTLKAMSSRKEALSIDLVRRIDEVKKEMSVLGIDCQDVCVVSDAVLNFHNIFISQDFDIVVASAIREKHFRSTAMLLTDNINVVKENYAVDIGGGMVTDDQLIYDRAYHIQVRGLKFAALDVVRRQKSCSRNDKDVLGLASIGRREWFGKNDS